MSGAPPRVTIGLPVYNAAQYVREAIESILGQTFTDLSLVIADNASTDSTLEIAESYAARDARITILRSDENRGAAWNFNRVFEGCRSPYFKWAAADDLLAPACLEHCVAALHAAPGSFVLAFPQTSIIDAEGRIVGRYTDPVATSPDEPPHRRLARVVANVVKGNLAFALMRTEALQRTRLHGGYPSSDYVLFAELSLLGAFLEVPEPLFLRREHPAMSRRASASLGDISHWFDPAAKPVRSEMGRLFREHVAAIRHVPLSARERALALAVLVPTWGRRRWLLGLRGRLRSAVDHLRNVRYKE